MPFDEFYRSGVVFTAAIGGGQEDKYGNPRAYVDINDMFTIFSFQGAYAKANPRNIRGIFSKLSTIFAAWETGHHLGNEFNISSPNIEVPTDPFDRGLPVYMQVSRETRSQAIDQFFNSPIHAIQSTTFGIDTSKWMIKDTIVPVIHTRAPETPHKRSIRIGPPSLNRNK